MATRMTRPSELRPVQQSGPYWHLAAVVLLLCGLALWGEVEQQDFTLAESAPSFSQLESLPAAIPNDFPRASLRSQPEPTTGGVADRDSDWHGIPARATEPAPQLLRLSVLPHSSLPVPRTARYQLQVPRAPPTA